MSSRRAVQLLRPPREPFRPSSLSIRSHSTVVVAPRTWTPAVARTATRASRTATAQGLHKNATGRYYEARRFLTQGGEDKPSKMYSFDEIQDLTSQPLHECLLLDTREPLEYSSGTIPHALNLPVSSHPDALLLPEDDFYHQFGFSKPSPDTELIFFCKAGVRSRAAAQIAKRAGYAKVGEYQGSMLEWTEQGGHVEMERERPTPQMGDMRKD